MKNLLCRKTRAVASLLFTLLLTGSGLCTGPNAAQAATGDINTVAGNGTFGSGGDGGPATAASLGNPYGVARDSAGNLYIADSFNHRIRKVNAVGVISNVAGDGLSGFSGDGGPATAARLNNPYGVAVDSAGNLLIADSFNNRIRKVDAAGVITTVAGSFSSTYSGDGGPATSAGLNSPNGMAVDSAGNLLIADSRHQCIRKVNAAGIISTVAGNTTTGFSGDGGPATAASLNNPNGVAVDSAGNLFIADNANQRIRKVNAAGVITTVAGNGTRAFGGDGGLATAASLNLPNGVAVDSAGNLFIGDSGNNRIRKVSNGIISTAAGNGTAGSGGDNGPATAANLNFPTGVAVDSAGNLFIGDQRNQRIRKVNAPVISTAAGTGTAGFSGDGGQATAANLYAPGGVAVDSAGNLFIADSFNNRIRKVIGNGTISTVAGNGWPGFSGDGGQATAARLNTPYDVAVDGAGNLFIADLYNQRIRKVDSNGTISTVAGNGTAGFSGDGGQATAASLSYPNDVAVDKDGNLFIADQNNQRIRKVSSNGTISTMAGNGTKGFSGDGGQATAASLNNPVGVAVDGAGNLFIADRNNQRIRKVDSNGTISTVAGNWWPGFSGDGGQATAASLNNPFGVAVDSAGNLFIADYLNNRIRKVSGNGIISTVAGNGTAGFSGDGSQATAASLNFPRGVAVDSAGNFFIADVDNNRIRQVK